VFGFWSLVFSSGNALFLGIKTVSFPTQKIMTLEEFIPQVKACSKRMNEHYGRPVFDEWAVVSLVHHQARVLAYLGARNDDFLKNFANDLGTLRMELLNDKYQVGDFEFARQGEGTKFEAFMVVGPGIYLICSNTQTTMNEIAKDPRWLTAQVPFAELSDKIRSNPLVHAVN